MRGPVPRRHRRRAALTSPSLSWHAHAPLGGLQEAHLPRQLRPRRRRGSASSGGVRGKLGWGGLALHSPQPPPPAPSPHQVLKTGREGGRAGKGKKGKEAGSGRTFSTANANTRPSATLFDSHIPWAAHTRQQGFPRTGTTGDGQGRRRTLHSCSSGLRFGGPQPPPPPRAEGGGAAGPHPIVKAVVPGEWAVRALWDVPTCALPRPPAVRARAA